MFYVISGYCGPDNYTSDNGPILALSVCKTPEEVEKLYADFRENCYGKDKDQHVFRIIEGRERNIKPVEKVTKYELE